mgnify:CR=1 FL=1
MFTRAAWALCDSIPFPWLGNCTIGTLSVCPDDRHVSARKLVLVPNDAVITPESPPSSAVEPARIAVSTSLRLRRIRHLESLLGVTAILSPRKARQRGIVADVVLVWGRKRSAASAREYARRQGLPVWYLEDGWVRSASADAHSRVIYSLLVDPIGVYYDGSSPSLVERFLNRPGSERARDIDDTALEYARLCRQRLVASNITKYNFCPAARLPSEDGRPLVLVVDQTRDDASVHFGGLEGTDFVEMLDAACRENPGAQVIVRTHPDVVAGRRTGYLDAVARSRGIEVSAAGDDPLPWLKRAARVYVGTSQMGYEALLCDRPVTVFGMPFYAGWGLSDDRRPIPRRKERPSIDELFHATHVHLARYVSPLTGERWELADCLAHVELQRREFARNAHHFHCIGITPWKRRYVERFLRSPDGSVRFGRARASNIADVRLCWSFRGRTAPVTSVPAAPAPRDTAVANSEASPQRDPGAVSVWRMEDGFLRSNGLGSDFTAPGSLVVDTRGIYFDPATPSDLEVLLETHDCTPFDVKRAAALRQRILASGLSKYNLASRTGSGNTFNYGRGTADRKHVLVVGQVESDESIRRGCAEVRTNAALLQAVRKAHPDAWIVYRPHPDVEIGNRKGLVDDFVLQSCADEVDQQIDVSASLAACAELHTMTSLAGFEALMRGKSVTTYGAPFYAGWGLTTDHEALARRSRKRTLDELVFLTLIAYPRYIDIASGEFATAEDTVRIIETAKAAGRQGRGGLANWPGRQLAKVVNLARGLSYAP